MLVLMGVVPVDRCLLHINLHIHLKLLLNCVHKYTDIYKGIGLLALNGPYTHLNCVHKYKDIYDGISLLALKKKWQLREGVYSPSVSIFLLNCVHKYTNIYDGIGLKAIKGALVVDSGVYSISISS